MTLTLDRAREMAQGPLTTIELRDISDAALLATGWTREPAKRSGWYWTRPDGYTNYNGIRPNPAADLTAAEKWMVPEGWHWTISGPYEDGTFSAECGGPDQFQNYAKPAALALTLAGWAATLEGGK